MVFGKKKIDIQTFEGFWHILKNVGFGGGKNQVTIKSNKKSVFFKIEQFFLKVKSNGRGNI